MVCELGDIRFAVYWKPCRFWYSWHLFFGVEMAQVMWIHQYLYGVWITLRGFHKLTSPIFLGVSSQPSLWKMKYLAYLISRGGRTPPPFRIGYTYRTILRKCNTRILFPYHKFIKTGEWYTHLTMRSCVGGRNPSPLKIRYASLFFTGMVPSLLLMICEVAESHHGIVENLT